MRSLLLAATLGLTVLGASCAEAPAARAPALTTVPPRPLEDRKAELVDVLHGVKVPDPYRWLEDRESAEVRSWTETQNARTRKTLDAIPGRAALKAEIAELLQIGLISAPTIRLTKTGRRYFFTKRAGMIPSALYVRDGESGEEKILIDVVALSEAGATLDWSVPSSDGRLIAWSKSESGARRIVQIRDVATGKDMPFAIDRMGRNATLAWMPDGKSFYYSGHPAAGAVPPGEARAPTQIFHHVLGQDPKDDKLVFGAGRDTTDDPHVSASPNGRWLVVEVYVLTSSLRTEVYFKDLSKGASAPFVGVAVKPAVNPDSFSHAIPTNDRLFLRTDDGARNYRLFAIDYAKPERRAWKEVVPETKEPINAVAVLKDEVVVSYLGASTRLERYTFDGKAKGAIELPGVGNAGVEAVPESDEVFIAFGSSVAPSHVYRMNVRKGAALEPWLPVDPKFLGADLEMTILVAEAKDGKIAPVYVISKKGLKRDGSHPTVIEEDNFDQDANEHLVLDARAFSAVRRGAVWVRTILRGAGARGFSEETHEAGMLEKSQKRFDDLFGCANVLFKEGFTRPEKLGVFGGSKAGPLVGAAVTQHPEMFRVAVSRAPLTDMLRYHKLETAKPWMPEYGDPDKAEHFQFLHAYSPYHHVVDGTKYPALLFTAAENEFDPMHARKMAARMQKAQGDPTRPVLVRLDSTAGKATAEPVSRVADELADEVSFLLHEMGVPLGPPAP